LAHESRSVASPHAHAAPIRYLERSGCPVCEAARSQAVECVRSNMPAEEAVPSELGRFLQGYDGDRSFFTYFRCANCGVLYCPVYFTQEQLDQLYREQPENMEEISFEARRRTQQSYFDILKRHSRLAGQYLEIGCDNGLFASICDQNGQFDKFWLYEPNRAVHSAIEARFAGREFNIRSERFAPRHVANDKISTAAIIHVLDHVLNPRDLLADLHGSLERGGVVLSVTHNEASLIARTLGRRFPPFCLQHPQLYSPQSIQALYERAGFEVVKVVKTWNYFPLPAALNGALKVLGGGLDVLERLSWPLFGAKFGNIAVIARKIS
jgi:hypothetical protein